MKITGQMLKEAREAQKLSLSEISMSTKINQRMLKAIEEGDLDHLPAKTFLRGFVQAYAIALKLDVDQVMNTFLEEMGTTTPEVAEVTEENAAPPTNGRQLPSMETSSTTKIIVVAGIVALILVVFGIKSVVEKYERESLVEPPPETLNSLPAPPVEESAEGIDEDTDQDAPEPAESETPAASPKPEEKTAETTPPPPAPEKKAEEAEPAPVAAPTAPPKPTPPTASAPESAATAPAPAAPTKPVETAQSKEVILEALDRIEVAVKVGNEALKKVVLQPDEVYTIKGEGRISLDLSDGGAVNLIVNGRERGVPGDLGKPKKVELP